jgi:hypothetical protein
MADNPPVPVPLPGEVPFLPQTPEQAAVRDGMSVPLPSAPPAVGMSVGSPAADDALVGALETAHHFISRVTGWRGHETERQDVLELTAAALHAITAQTP